MSATRGPLDQHLERDMTARPIDTSSILQPLDIDTLAASTAKTGCVIVVHQAVRFGGISLEVIDQITERCFGEFQSPAVRLGAPFGGVWSKAISREGGGCDGR
jgi:acetoin:2,6-dichlorophenolindophenol oxidoreductase subunit beta